MLIRRAFHRALFPAALVLPVWLLVGWGLFGAGAWSFLGLLVLCPVLFLALVAVSALVYARPSVRATKALSWRDVGLFSAWYATIIGFGFFGATSGWFAVAGILLGLAAFWSSITSLLADAARQMRDAYESARVPGAGRSAGPLPPLDGGEYIVVHENGS